MSSTKPDLPLHPVHKSAEVDEFDLFIAGSGPIGATYARLLVDRGFNVCMVEIGDLHDSLHPGSHQKNEIRFQKDIDKFVRVIQGALSTVSIPTSSMVNPTLDPVAWTATTLGDQATISHNRNPYQKLYNNLGAEAVTRCVGGMSTHWTCATPEFLKGLERPKIFPNDEAKDDEEWRKLYKSARKLIGTSDKEFEHSIRHNVVLDALKNVPEYKNRGVKALPLACHRIGESPYVRWHSAENVFGPKFFIDEPTPESGKGKFRLVTNTRCTKLWSDVEDSGDTHIEFAEVQDLIAAMKGEAVDYAIKAKVFVVASGAVATPQILANSGFGGLRSQEKDKNVLLPALGRRITEQPMAFCQIVLRKELVDDVTSRHHPDWWRRAVEKHRKENPKDPLPIPFEDPEPQVTIPATKEFPWHTQIHRDAFSYGEAGPLVDSRVVVDLRFFGMQEGVVDNRVLFEDDVKDMFGMPQPTFEYTPTRKYAIQATDMMKDMTNVAYVLGGYLPGSNPQFMTPGLALHLGGTVRLGHEEEKKESVADYYSRVWDTTNLYVAGNGVIPTAFGANPTLTSMAFAIRSAYDIYVRLTILKEELSTGTQQAAQRSPPVQSALARIHARLPQNVPEDRGRWRWSSPTRGGNSGRVLVPDTTISPTPDGWLTWATDAEDPNYPRHKELRGLNSILVL